MTPGRKVEVALDYGSSPKFGGPPLIFMHWLKLATSKLICGWRLPKPIINFHAHEKVGVSWLGDLSKILGFPFNIFAVTKLATSKLACS